MILSLILAIGAGPRSEAARVYHNPAMGFMLDPIYWHQLVPIAYDQLGLDPVRTRTFKEVRERMEALRKKGGDIHEAELAFDYLRDTIFASENEKADREPLRMLVQGPGLGPIQGWTGGHDRKPDLLQDWFAANRRWCRAVLTMRGSMPYQYLMEIGALNREAPLYRRMIDDAKPLLDTEFEQVGYPQETIQSVHQIDEELDPNRHAEVAFITGAREGDPSEHQSMIRVYDGSDEINELGRVALYRNGHFGGYWHLPPLLGPTRLLQGARGGRVLPVELALSEKYRKKVKGEIRFPEKKKAWIGRRVKAHGVGGEWAEFEWIAYLLRMAHPELIGFDRSDGPIIGIDKELVVTISSRPAAAKIYLSSMFGYELRTDVPQPIFEKKGRRKNMVRLKSETLGLKGPSRDVWVPENEELVLTMKGDKFWKIYGRDEAVSSHIPSLKLVTPAQNLGGPSN